MYSRVTQLEIDTVRADVDEALALFRERVLPHLREQEGFEGVLVLATPDGKGILISFWESEEAAAAGVEGGYYAEAIERHMTLFRSPPGRERYEVALAEWPILSVR